MTSFVVVNQCSDPDLTPELLADICKALDIQLNRDVATRWGGSFRVRPATPDAPPTDGEEVAAILDALPGADATTIAYHTWQGVALIYVARAMCSSLTTGNGSVSQALSHELCEAVGDEACNIWVDDLTGTEWARELCDPVESQWYQFFANIAVSDFVLPAYFEPGAMKPYSHLEIVGGDGPQAPFGLAPGGYAVKRTAGGEAVEVFGEISDARRAKKVHPSSRTYRRGVRLAPAHRTDGPAAP